MDEELRQKKNWTGGVARESDKQGGGIVERRYKGVKMGKAKIKRKNKEMGLESCRTGGERVKG